MQQTDSLLLAIFYCGFYIKFVQFLENGLSRFVCLHSLKFWYNSSGQGYSRKEWKLLFITLIAQLSRIFVPSRFFISFCTNFGIL